MRMRTLLLVVLLLPAPAALGQHGTIPAFPLERSPIELSRLAQPNTYMDKVGRRFALLGSESGTFEAWAYPLKLFRNFELAFLVRSSTEPIRARDIVRQITVRPEATTITYASQSFTVYAHVITAIDEPGAVLLLEVHSTEPLTIIASFLPVLQPMWPAGLGGQYAYWDDATKAYLISEPTRKNHGYIGSPAASGISYTPAHMLADVPNQFKIECAFPDSLRGRFIPIVMAGGPGLRDSVKAVYERLVAHPERMYRDAHEHYRVLRTSTLQISTPNREIDLAFEWAKVAYDNLFVNNPHLGLGMIAGLGPSGTGGRPGFGWFFGGDAFINAFSMNSYGAFSSTRDALAFTEQWQRADGKMAHELSQAAAYVDWWKDYPYGYIHGDTSPFFLCAAEDYFRMTGDSAFVRSSWNTIRKAYEWSLATDEDHDGLMDNRKAGLGALEYGPLTDIQSDVYTGAVWVRATDAMVALADVAGQPDLAVHAAGYAKTSHHAFEEKFWDPAHHRYAYAFSKNGTRVDIVSPWSSVGLMWELGDPGRSAQALEELNSAELTTDWGIRSISSRSKYFEALNYNYGAVWPFLSSWVATAQFKHGFGLQGYNLLLANVRHTFDNGLGTVTEVFSGAQNIWPQEAVAHQGFCTAGVVLPLVRGLLGLESDAPGRRISVAPQCPADWPALTIQNWTVGPARFALDYQRLADRITLKITPENANGFRCTFGPVIGSTNTISSVRVNGMEVPFRLITSSQSIQPLVDVPVDGATTMEILMQQGVELLPPLIDSKTGDANHGLKIISMKRTGNRLEVSLDGVAGAIYAIGVLNAPRIGSLDGATLTDGEIRMTMPPGPFGEFVRHRFTITLNEEHR